MTSERTGPIGEAVAEYQRRTHRKDGPQVATALASGLSGLRDQFYERLHFDVERLVGADSMFVPLSEFKTQQRTKLEIDVYQVAESACTVHAARYLAPADDWYLPWLARLRLETETVEEGTLQRIRSYRAQSAEGRARAFADGLLDLLPESGRAPLVLFRLVPLGIQLVTAQAFADRARAADLRRQQAALLPAIADCVDCHGALQEPGQRCERCGNPLWKFQWLTSM